MTNWPSGSWLTFHQSCFDSVGTRVLGRRRDTQKRTAEVLHGRNNSVACGLSVDVSGSAPCCCLGLHLRHRKWSPERQPLAWQGCQQRPSLSRWGGPEENLKKICYPKSASFNSLQIKDSYIHTRISKFHVTVITLLFKNNSNEGKFIQKRKFGSVNQLPGEELDMKPVKMYEFLGIS